MAGNRSERGIPQSTPDAVSSTADIRASRLVDGENLLSTGHILLKKERK